MMGSHRKEKQTGRSVRAKGHGGERRAGVLPAGWHEVGWSGGCPMEPHKEGWKWHEGDVGVGGQRQTGRQEFPEVH